jgi:hypothetical protein
VWSKVSLDAIDFLKYVFRVNEFKILSAAELMEHPFLNIELDGGVVGG